jgi:ankyrin repeat protein
MAGRMMKEVGLLVAIMVIALAGCGEPARYAPPTKAGDRALIIACLHLDLAAVRTQFAAGADANARYGTADSIGDLLDSHGGYPMDGDAWTPLIALANAELKPAVIIRDSDGIIQSRTANSEVDPHEVAAREATSMEIFAILRDHGCDINATGHHGATALYSSCYKRNLSLSLALIAAKAKVNTRVGRYIDGTYDETPLFRALWSSVLVEALLKAGARKSARDSEWNRPIDWLNTVNPTQDELKVRRLLGG